MDDSQFAELLRRAHKLHEELRSIVAASECGPGLSREDVAAVIADDPSDARYEHVCDVLPRYRTALNAAWSRAYEMGLHERAARALLRPWVNHPTSRGADRAKLCVDRLWDSAVSHCALVLRTSVTGYDPDVSGVSFPNRVLEDCRRSFFPDVIARELPPFIRHRASADLGSLPTTESLDNFLEKARGRGCSGDDGDGRRRELAWLPPERSDEPDKLPPRIKRSGRRYLAQLYDPATKKLHSLGSYDTITEAVAQQDLARERLARGGPAKMPRERLPKGIARNGRSYTVKVYDTRIRKRVYVGSRGSLEDALALRDVALATFASGTPAVAETDPPERPSPREGTARHMEQSASDAMKRRAHKRRLMRVLAKKAEAAQIRVYRRKA